MQIDATNSIERSKVSKGGSWDDNNTQQCQTKSEHNEMHATIKCKHVKYVAQKELVDPKSHMVLDAQRWAKIVDDLQNMINVWVPQNVKTCKDKWNETSAQENCRLPQGNWSQHLFLGVTH